jgi:phosphomevalonate kinase
MKHWTWVAGLLAAFLMGATCAVAGDAGKKDQKKEERKKADPGLRGFNVMTADTIATKLGQETPLTEEQKGKVAAARETLANKYKEVHAKPEVQAAQDEIKKADEAVKAAQTKLKEAMGGFDANAEYKKALEGILSPEQLAKLYPTKPAPAKKGAAAKEEKKEE